MLINPEYHWYVKIHELQTQKQALFDELDDAKIYIKKLEKKLKEQKQCH